MQDEPASTHTSAERRLAHMNVLVSERGSHSSCTVLVMVCPL